MISSMGDSSATGKTMGRRRRELLDGFAPVWEWLSDCFSRRPMFVLALLVSAVIVLLSAVTFVKTASEVSDVSNAFCNGQKHTFDARQQRNCRALLDQLLRDPTPEQRLRIREIARGK